MSDSLPPGSLTTQRASLVLLVLAGGLVCAAFAAVFLRLNLQVDSRETPFVEEQLPDFALLLAAGGALTYFFLRRQLRARLGEVRAEALELLRRDVVPPLLFRESLLGAALAEGVSLFALVILILGGPWWLLALPALGLLAMLVLLPTRGRLEEITQAVRATP